MRSQRFLRGVALLAGLGWAGAACDDPLLPNAIFDNIVDTVTLSAVDGTPVASPSGYVLSTPFSHAVRTDLPPPLSVFDFAFNIDTAGRAVLIPASALRLVAGAGLLEVTSSFDDLKDAPGSGYNTDSVTVVEPNDVIAIRSRVITCELGNIFYYGKLRVLTVDTTKREMQMEILSDINCGYRSLEPGRPSR
jgi:hypothetical protein